jgi:hypothetical protein
MSEHATPSRCDWDTNTAQHAVSTKAVDALTRQMFVLHHRKELRHISFAKWVIASLVAELPSAELAGMRALLAHWGRPPRGGVPA